MGACGMGPFENDAAMDFVDDLMAPIDKISKKKLDIYSYEEVRAAAEIFLLMKCCNYRVETASLLVDKLEKILADNEWIGSWVDGGEEAKKDLKKQIKKLRALC